MRRFILATMVIFSVSLTPANAVDTVMLPLNCSELLPDVSPYLEFFEAVALGAVRSDPRFSKRLFRILSLREKVQGKGLMGRSHNPVDVLIRKTLCFYRDQKEPVRPIAFDDPKLLAFLKPAAFELETKVDQAVYDLELERYQRQQYELRLNSNRDRIADIKAEAERAAQSSFRKLEGQAKRKAVGK